MAWWFSQEHPCGHVLVVWVPETAVQHGQALREEDRVVGLWQSQDIWHHCREKVSVLNKIIYMICCTALCKNFLAWSYLPGTKFDSKLQILVHTLWVNHSNITSMQVHVHGSYRAVLILLDCCCFGLILTIHVKLCHTSYWIYHHFS